MQVHQSEPEDLPGTETHKHGRPQRVSSVGTGQGGIWKRRTNGVEAACEDDWLETLQN